MSPATRSSISSQVAGHRDRGRRSTTLSWSRRARCWSARSHRCRHRAGRGPRRARARPCGRCASRARSPSQYDAGDRAAAPGARARRGRRSRAARRCSRNRRSPARSCATRAKSVELARSALDQAQRQAAAAHALVDGADVPRQSHGAAGHARRTAMPGLPPGAMRSSRRSAATSPSAACSSASASPPGQALMTVIALDNLWVDANFKESQLRNLRIGPAGRGAQRPVRRRRRRSTARSWALRPAPAAAFALLPAQNASGNWIKVVQRVPVDVARSGGTRQASAAHRPVHHRHRRYARPRRRRAGRRPRGRGQARHATSTRRTWRRPTPRPTPSSRGSGGRALSAMAEARTPAVRRRANFPPLRGLALVAPDARGRGLQRSWRSWT